MMISSTVEKITPQKAATYLQNNYKHQRNINLDKVKFLASEMRRGRFGASSPIHFAICNGVGAVLINGQHTLSAVIDSGCTIELPVIRQDAESEDEIAKMYSRIDVGRKRRAFDSLAPFGYVENSSLSKTNLNSIMSAVMFINRGFVGSRSGENIAIEDQMTMLEDWIYTGEFVFDAILGVDRIMRRKLSNRATLSVVLATMRYQKQKAIPFWDGIVTGIGFVDGDPRSVLRDKLLTMDIQGGGTTTGKQFTSEYVARANASAWNSWFLGESRKVIIVRNDNAPIEIKGTPYI